MPIQRCQIDGQPGYRWGNSGKCYTGQGARAKALRQARAIRASGYTGNRKKRKVQVYNQRTEVVPSNPLKADPTRTTSLRRRFLAEVNKRFNKLKGEILKLIVEEDAFGLKQRLRNPFTQNTRWRFHTDAAKVQAFNAWLATRTQLNLIGVTQEDVENAYWAEFIEEGYRKGAGRAFTDVKAPALAAGQSLDFFQGSKEEFLRQSFANPETVEKVKLLAGRVFTDLKGVTDAMAADISRTLTEGLVRGQNPLTIARELNKRVTIGIKRARVISRTEIVRSHGEGQLDALERLGVTEVGVQVEWSTTGDDRVCPMCQPMEGVVMTTKEARGLLPRHPNCITGDMRVVAPGLVNVMRAEYTGEIVELVTAFGSVLSMTPHHILLSQRGWVFAKDLTDSDYLVDTRRSDRFSISPDDNLREPLISDVYRSLMERVDESRVINSLSMPEDLHGDGISVDSEISIINVDSVLGNKDQPLDLRQLVEPSFSFRNVGSIDSLRLKVLSSLDLFLDRASRTSDRLVSSLGITEMLLARSILHHQPISVGLSSQGDIHSGEEDLYPTSSDLVPLGERVNTNSFQVELTDLLQGSLVKLSSTRSFHVNSLPVYDLSTTSTAYTVEGIVTSNCRCAYVPASVGESKADQKRASALLAKARNKSIDAEIRRDIPLAQKKKLSRWPGADTKFRTKRPRSILEGERPKPKPKAKPKPVKPKVTPEERKRLEDQRKSDRAKELSKGLQERIKKHRAAVSAGKVKEVQVSGLQLRKDRDELRDLIVDISNNNSEVKEVRDLMAKGSRLEQNLKRKRKFIDTQVDELREEIANLHRETTLSPEELQARHSLMVKTLSRLDREYVNVQEEIRTLRRERQRSGLWVSSSERLDLDSEGVYQAYTIGGAKTKANISPTVERRMDEARATVENMTRSRGKTVKVFYHQLEDGGRAFHYTAPSKQNIRGGIYLEERDDVWVYVHELGHHLENEFEGLQDAAIQFRELRIARAGTQNEKLKDLFPNRNYSPSEIGNKDEFDKFFSGSSPYYAGKDYSGLGIDDTEIISMGMQALIQDPIGFAQKDPEYFGFIVAILRDLI